MAAGFLSAAADGPDLRLACRGVLGLAVPWALAQLFAWPALTGVGVAAFLLAFGDAAGGRGRQRRLLIASGVGACAVASGVLAGGHWLAAALGMAVLMAGAFVMHLKVRDPFKKGWPSLAMLLLCLAIAAL